METIFITAFFANSLLFTNLATFVVILYEKWREIIITTKKMRKVLLDFNLIDTGSPM